MFFFCNIQSLLYVYEWWISLKTLHFGLRCWNASYKFKMATCVVETSAATEIPMCCVHQTAWTSVPTSLFSGAQTPNHTETRHTNTTGWPQQEGQHLTTHWNFLVLSDSSCQRLIHHFCNVTQQLTPGIISVYLTDCKMRVCVTTNDSEVARLRQYEVAVSAGNKAKTCNWRISVWVGQRALPHFSFQHVCMCASGNKQQQRTKDALVC